MNEERQMVLDDALNYVALVLRNHPEVSFERKRRIAAEVSGIRTAEELKRTILELAGVAPAQAA